VNLVFPGHGKNKTKGNKNNFKTNGRKTARNGTHTQRLGENRIKEINNQVQTRVRWGRKDGETRLEM
jgi:hypothetical protein